MSQVQCEPAPAHAQHKRDCILDLGRQSWTASIHASSDGEKGGGRRPRCSFDLVMGGLRT
jgi:hypothetical protein